MSRRVALVIGNEDYAPFARPLQGPTGDALRIARLFEDLGFDLVQPQFDADYDAIRKGVRAFAAALEKGGIGAFYFSGHGVQGKDRENYLVPLNASLKEPEDIAKFCYPLRDVIAAIHGAESYGLLFLDACRNDPFAGVPDGPRTKELMINLPGLSVVPKKELSNILISYATGAGNTALDGDADHPSHYAEALAKHLPTPGVPIGSLLKRVGNQVSTATSLQQVPWVEDSLLADLILVPAPTDERPDDEEPDDHVKPDGGNKPDHGGRSDGGDIKEQLTIWGGLVLWAKRIAIAFYLVISFPIVFGIIFLYYLEATKPADEGIEPEESRVCDTSALANALFCRVSDLDHPSDDKIRTDTAKEIERALAGDSFSVTDKVLVVDALLEMAKSDRLRSLTPSGRFNVLARLADIPSGLWLEPLMLNSLETAHQVISGIDAAHLTNPFLRAETTDFLETWKTQAGYVLRSSIVIKIMFSGFNRDRELMPILLELSQGWGWPIPADPQFPVRAARDLDRSWIEYSDPSLEASAKLLAGQLNGEVTSTKADSPADAFAAKLSKPVQVVRLDKTSNDQTLRLFLKE